MESWQVLRGGARRRFVSVRCGSCSSISTSTSRSGPRSSQLPRRSAARPRRSERLPPVLERGVLDVHRDGAVDDVADSGRAKEVGQAAGPAAGQTDPVSTSGSSAWAASQNGPIGPPSVKSQTHAATMPPSRVTLAISRRPATGSSMTLTTSWASVASKQPPSNGRSSAGARMTWTPGWRPRRAATNSSDGSTAVTRPGVALRTSSAVSAPGAASDVEDPAGAGVRRNRRRAPPAASSSGP